MKLTTQYGNVSKGHHRHNHAPASVLENKAATNSSASRFTLAISCNRTAAMGAALSTSGRRQVDADAAPVCNLPVWLLSELFEQFPRVGDRKSLNWCFFFDEAICCSPTRPRP